MTCRQFDVYPDGVKSLSTAISGQLAEMIHAGALKPGVHLVQTDLAERFGVSRVAVRDALAQLRQRGLAVNVPRKGMGVGREIRGPSLLHRRGAAGAGC
jgi:DNA-binding GntR family transcriptional regulator